MYVCMCVCVCVCVCVCMYMYVGVCGRVGVGGRVGVWVCAWRAEEEFGSGSVDVILARHVQLASEIDAIEFGGNFEAIQHWGIDL